MNTTQEATAVAPAINGKDVAVHTVKTITSAAHIGFTVLADLCMYAGAHIVNKIDNTQSVQDTVDYVQAKTDTKLNPLRQKLSGYKPAPTK
jgi:hypothetical protein